MIIPHSMPTSVLPSSRSPRPRAKNKRPSRPAEAEVQRRLEDIELATVSAVRALQMDLEGDPGVPSAAVMKRARQAIR